MRTMNRGTGWLASLRRVLLEAAKSLAALALISAAGLSPAWAQVTVTLTAPADGATFSAPANITLTASASAPKGYKISKVEFFNGTSLVGADAKSPYSLLWRNVEAGSYTLTAKATAVKKNQPDQIAISDGVLITVSGPNTPPVVSMTSPSSGASFTAPANITISADAADADGTVSKVEFFHGGTTLIATVTSPPYSITWTGVPQGAYTLTARASDNLNATTTSDPVGVTVNPGVAQLYFIHTDHLNTPRLITNQAQQAVWRWDNIDPFGGNPPDENPSGLGVFNCNLRLPGQYFDKETNLHYNYFRDYDPAIGRYIQSDPIGMKGGINTYVYAYDPLTQVDPRGLMGRASGASVSRGAPKVKSICGTGIFTGPAFTFASACEVHDRCYDTCGANRFVCDDNFSRLAHASCPPGDVMCYSLAVTYYTLMKFGGMVWSFDAAQREACQRLECR